jgi:hypothetical protein
MLCSRVQNLLSAYCDHELTGAEMLQIRSHLAACPACRQEQESILQVKRLMGALSCAEPPSPFDPGILDATARRPWLWSQLCRAARPYLTTLTEARDAVARSGAERLRALQAMPSRLALSGTTAVVLVTFALVHAPQHPDAVSAHVPEIISSEDRSLALLPLNEVVPAAGDPLPDEVSAIQAAETIGAEQPIRLVSYDPNAPAPRFESARYAGFSPYAAVYSPVAPAGFTGVVTLSAFNSRDSHR